MIGSSQTWQLKKLSDLCAIQSGGTPSRAASHAFNGDIPWAKIADLETSDGIVTTTEERITSAGLAAIGGRLFPAGSLLLAMYGSVGKNATAGVELSANQAILGIQIERLDLLDQAFLRHWFSHYQPRLVARACGVTQKNISATIVRDLEIPLPPLDEQRRIAAILDKADAIRRKRREAIRLLDDFLRATFLDMFGDPVTNPKGWPIVPLTEAVNNKYGIKAGPFGSSIKKEDYTSSGFRVYGQEQVIAGRFDIGNYYIDENKFDKLKSCAVSLGDVLVSLVGSYGKVLVVPEGIEPGIINPRLLKITPRKDLVTSIYLATLLENEAIQTKLKNMSHGGTMGILNAGLLKQLDIPLPPIKDQLHFSTMREAVSKQKKVLLRHASESESLFSSLQSRAFKGGL